ncbi:MAG: hypothetical protein RSC66_07725, partial [Comamonas sp.]
MLYLSTRGHSERKRFCDILLEGLAPDGGLYLPESYPQIDDAQLSELRRVYHEQGYAELAFRILSLYIDDIPADDLREGRLDLVICFGPHFHRAHKDFKTQMLLEDDLVCVCD